MKTIDAILQARMRSARLPGKSLAPVLGRPILSLIVERLRRCRTVRRLVIATSVDPLDDAIERTGGADGVPVFRGSEDDVLDRLYQCAAAFGMRVFARFTADNPLIDPAVADQVIGYFLDRDGELDYVSNNHPPTWPDGFEVEVVRVEALACARRETSRPFQREHATPYIWDQPERFRIANVALPSDDLFRRTRWTLDCPEDYEFVARVYEALYPVNPAFGMADILALLDREPDLRNINAHLGSETWYRDHLGELRTVSGDITRKHIGPHR